MVKILAPSSVPRMSTASTEKSDILGDIVGGCCCESGDVSVPTSSSLDELDELAWLWLATDSCAVCAWLGDPARGHWRELLLG